MYAHHGKRGFIASSKERGTFLTDRRLYLTRTSRLVKLHSDLARPCTDQWINVQSAGQPFVVTTPSNNHIFISSKEAIEQLIEASPSQLSLHAVAKEVRLFVKLESALHGLTFSRCSSQGIRCTGLSGRTSEALKGPDSSGH